MRALAIPLLFALAATACSEAETTRTGALTPEVAALKTHLPANAKIVAGVDVRVARGIQLFQKLSAELPLPPELVTAGEVCGLDPLQDLDLAVAALTDLRGLDRMVVALKGRFTRDSIAKCARDLSARSGNRVKITDKGTLTTYASVDGKAYAYWPAADTVVISRAAIGSPDVLTGLATGGGAASPELMTDLALVDTRAALWIAGAIPPEAQSRITALGPGAPAVPGFFATVGGKGDRVDVLFGLRMSTADQAKGSAAGFRQQKDELAELAGDPVLAAVIKRVKVVQAGSSVSLEVALTTAEAERVLAAVERLREPAGGK